jgi:UDP-2,3-diacylglucosamine pyrophosphatase LpxH
MHRNPVILQISDLHFGRNTRPYLFLKSSVNEEAVQALTEAIVRLEPKPDFLIVTGDLANRGKVKELRQARAYLEDLLDRLWKQNHVARCILIPGNHDVWKTTWARPSGFVGRRDRLRAWNKVFGDGWSFLAKNVPADRAAHLTPYSLRDYYASPDGDGAKAAAAEAACEYFPAFRVAFLKLDSNVRRHRWRPEHIARGNVGLPQRARVNAALEDYRRATKDQANHFSDARLVALVHHHVTRLPNVKLEKWMLMDDAGAVARWLAACGVRLVLHGHYHSADIMGLTFWQAHRHDRKVETIVISAGSATAKEVDDGHNSCHHIELGHFRTRVTRPILDHGEYKPASPDARYEFLHAPDLTIEHAEAPIYKAGLEASLANEETYADRDHAYTSIESYGYVDANRSYWGSLILEGVNQSAQPTLHLPFVFSGVGALYFSETKCRARDLLTGKPLPEVQLAETRPVHVFPCRIPFAAPLKPNGGAFKIQVDYFLSGVMLDEWDFDVLNLMRFPRGVARVKMQLVSDKLMVGPELLQLRGERLTLGGLTLTPVTVRPAHPASAPEKQGFEFTEQSPESLCYLFLYRRLTEHTT